MRKVFHLKNKLTVYTSVIYKKSWQRNFVLYKVRVPQYNVVDTCLELGLSPRKDSRGANKGILGPQSLSCHGHTRRWVFTHHWLSEIDEMSGWHRKQRLGGVLSGVRRGNNSRRVSSVNDVCPCKHPCLRTSQRLHTCGTSKEHLSV